jgi:hypothetical protein
MALMPLSVCAQPGSAEDSPQQDLAVASPDAGQASLVDPGMAVDSQTTRTRLGPGERAILGSGVRPEEAGSDKPPPYKHLRYDEDYRYLRDPSRRTDFWDPLKYISTSSDPDWYLSIGGETREWFELFHNPGFGSLPESANGYNLYPLQRYMLHADVHFGTHFRVFVQSVTGLEYGAIGGPRPQIDFNEFDAHQAFADIVLSDDSDSQDSVTLRLGRQEMYYGSGRLVDVREGPNLRLSFDAARVLVRKGEWAVDGFWSKPVLNNPGVFDDEPNPSQSFWGVYGVHPFAVLPDGHADLYYLGFENANASFNQVPGHELRHTLGTRLWGAPLPWEYNVELMYQFGTFNSGEIQAWSVASAARYNFSERPLKPRLGLRADVASGDKNRNSPNLQSFNPLFPSGIYFNLANPVGPINMIDLHPILDLTLSATISLTADWNFFWRESLGDGIYALSGALVRPAGPSRARYVGSSPSLTMIWAANRHITVLASYVHVFPGEFILQEPPSKPVDYFTTWLTYKF